MEPSISELFRKIFILRIEVVDLEGPARDSAYSWIEIQEAMLRGMVRRAAATS